MKFYGELLIFILVFITNLRVFFVKSVKHDNLTAVAPLSLLLSVLQIIAWGVDTFTAAAFILAFLVLLSNFHAMFRYSEQLLIDHYSPLMKIWAIFTSILSIFSIIFILIFSPIDYKNSNLHIDEEKTNLNGSFRAGFNEAKTLQIPNAYRYKFSPRLDSTNPDKTTPIILFVPDKRGDTFHYRPFLQHLAKESYTIYSTDYFSDDCKWIHTSFLDSKYLRRLALINQAFKNPERFESQREFFSYNISLELEENLNFLTKNYGKNVQFIIIYDSMSKTAVADFLKNHPEKVLTHFSLDSFSEYKTPGYGIIAQTDPLLSKIFNIEKDKSGFYTKKLVEESVKLIEKSISIENPTETKVE